MSSIERFEDIQAWQEARALTKIIYGLSSQGDWARDFGLCDQIRRAVVSVMSNIAEGFDRKANTEFHRFLAIAKGSAAEVKAQLYVALDLGYIDKCTFASTYESADKVSRMIGSLMNYLKEFNTKKPERTTHNK
ncbi:MAG: four helix bundle protein [Armatimonadota bacterium]|nr:four helix bundle protein [bacterium]